MSVKLFFSLLFSSSFYYKYIRMVEGEWSICRSVLQENRAPSASGQFILLGQQCICMCSGRSLEWTCPLFTIYSIVLAKKHACNQQWLSSLHLFNAWPRVYVQGSLPPESDREAVLGMMVVDLRCLWESRGLKWQSHFENKWVSEKEKEKLPHG